MLTMQERRLSPGSEEASYPKTSGWIPAHAVITITFGFVALLLAGVRGIAFAIIPAAIGIPLLMASANFDKAKSSGSEECLSKGFWHLKTYFIALVVIQLLAICLCVFLIMRASSLPSTRP